MASYDALNPIRSVAPYDIISSSAGASVYVPSPSSYQYNLNDVSSPDAGRTMDTLMHKLRLSQKVSLNLAWQNVTTTELSEILQAFNPEYLAITYLDGLQGAYVRKVFYVGDRSTPLYNNTIGVWSNVQFNVIER